MMRLIVAASVIFVLILTQVSFAQSQLDSSFEKILSNLINQLRAIQEQLNQLEKETPTPPPVVQIEIQETVVLKRGMRGTAVKELQEKLAQYPDIYPEGLVTGYFGPKTEKALKKFQEKYELEVAGVANDATIAQLNKIAPIIIPSGTVPVTPTSPATPATPVISSAGGGGATAVAASPIASAPLAFSVASVQTAPIASSADKTSPIISGIKIEISSDKMWATANWITNEPTTSVVRYGDQLSTIAGYPDLIVGTIHSMRIPIWPGAGGDVFQIESKDNSGNVAKSDILYLKNYLSTASAIPAPVPSAQVVLSVAKNPNFSDPSYTTGTTNAKLASFVLTSSGGIVSFSQLVFDKDSNAGIDLENLTVKVNDVPFSNSVTFVGNAESSIRFINPTPVYTQEGVGLKIEVFGNITNTSFVATHASVIDLLYGVTSVPWPTLEETGGQNVIVSDPSQVQSASPADSTTLTNTGPLVTNVAVSKTNLSPSGDLTAITYTAEDPDGVAFITLNFDAPDGTARTSTCYFSTRPKNGTCTDAIHTGTNERFNLTGTYTFSSRGLEALDALNNKSTYYPNNLNIPNIKVTAPLSAPISTAPEAQLYPDNITACQKAGANWDGTYCLYKCPAGFVNWGLPPILTGGRGWWFGCAKEEATYPPRNADGVCYGISGGSGFLCPDKVLVTQNYYSQLASVLRSLAEVLTKLHIR